MAIPPPQPSGYQLWYYYPSLPGNIIFAALFLILSIVHSIGLAMNRLTFCVPLVVGGIFEIVGYAIRAVAHYETGSVPAYAAQNLMVLLAPILFAASVYMYLGRLMIATHTEGLSPIPTKYLTKAFVSGDILCFIIQAAGGAMMSVKKLADKMYIGEYVILAGLILQILFFGLFVIVVVVVHKRMARKNLEDTTIAWRRLLLVLYTVSGLIAGRNVFRAVEYGLGSDGYLLTNEWTGFVFDGALMVLVLTICISWYIGGGSKLNPRYDGYGKTDELKPMRRRSLSA